ncbi:dual specificity mitogen-activated protein kinase kinase 2 [Galendromus occidentalis]|uniref:mitogen-activated protein kinase kinase n=1 Tax=Galendromus occidentalis TaxID=34638 RepID=A0AAJ6QW04_9ACAR|nr:dual specificity mitogen-activated protein kinase kinase 2 [Galendromus occidentalis]
MDSGSLAGRAALCGIKTRSSKMSFDNTSNMDGQKMKRRNQLRLSFGSGHPRRNPPEPNTFPASTTIVTQDVMAHQWLPPRTAGSGTLRLSPQVEFTTTAEDLKDLGEIGAGSFGCVNRMKHVSTGHEMAVKRIRSTMDEHDQQKLKIELSIVMKNDNDFSYIVQFYGTLFREGDCWICMELMDTSLHELYKRVFGRGRRIPENVLTQVAFSTVKALYYLKETLQMIHRDIKPSNILLNRKGEIKMCDFGISGRLIDSIAKTRDAGCQAYMAPERIDPSKAINGYDVRSDVWSLGITLVEVSLGQFPYPDFSTIFEQLNRVVSGEPPLLKESDCFSKNYTTFVNQCLIKEFEHRPKYDALLKTPLLANLQRNTMVVAEFLSTVLPPPAITPRPS